MLGKTKHKEVPTSSRSVNSRYSHKTPQIETISCGSSNLSDVPSHLIIRSLLKYGKRGGFRKGFLLDYTHKTTIHGIRYIYSIHRPLYERLFWLVATLTSFYFGVIYIWSTYLKWKDSPLIVGFDETLIPIHTIPFPTVTICPEIKMDRTVFNFTNMSERFLRDDSKTMKDFRNTENFTQEELEYFAATLHICKDEIVQRFQKFVPDTIKSNVAETLVDISISKNETAPFCQWNGRYYFCHHILTFVPTDEGICYQFNGLQPRDIYRNLSEVAYYDPDVVDFQNYFDRYLPPLNNLSGNWSLEDGYIEQGFHSYPLRTVLSSARYAFVALLQGFEPNFEYACRSFSQGYKVFLSSPENAPSMSENYVLLSHNKEVVLNILPEYIIADKNLHEFSPEIRGCYFSNERYLRYFRHYSQSNCETECLANYTIAKCGCAKFWMPKPADVPVCAVKDIDCYTNAQKELNLLLQKQTVAKMFDSNAEIICICHPSCTSLNTI